MALGLCLQSCCITGCHLCAGTRKIPSFLTLIISDAIDHDCPSANVTCPTAPDPISPFSDLNGEHELNYVEAYSTPEECIYWYESDPIPYGPFLASALGTPDCLIPTDATIVFSAEVIATSGPSSGLQINLGTYAGTEDGLRFYVPVAVLYEGWDWICDSELTSDEFVSGGYNFVATTSDDPFDAYDVRFEGGDCEAIRDANPPTIQMKRSAAEITP